MTKEHDTIWRVSVEDLKVVIEDKYPLLTPTEVERAIEVAYAKFSIHEWEQQVDDFLAVYMDRIKD